jgi:hypothetical protein
MPFVNDRKCLKYVAAEAPQEKTISECLPEKSPIKTRQMTRSRSLVSVVGV